MRGTTTMKDWEALLEIQWPANACDQSGECCRGAAQSSPWQHIMAQAAHGDLTARAFLSQYQPYPSLQEAIAHAPAAVAASQEIAELRGDQAENLVFYRCIYLRGKNECQIYEDRPTLCREFPESPFGAIPKCCGYHPIKQHCQHKIQSIREELAELKKLQSMLE